MRDHDQERGLELAADQAGGLDHTLGDRLDPAGPPLLLPDHVGHADRQGLVGLVEQERLRRMVEGLKTPDYQMAASQLHQAGFVAVPLLIETLERRDVELRRQAFAVLQQILGNGTAFDPYAPEAQRRQQIAMLREKLERKAS